MHDVVPLPEKHSNRPLNTIQIRSWWSSDALSHHCTCLLRVDLDLEQQVHTNIEEVTIWGSHRDAREFNDVAKRLSVFVPHTANFNLLFRFVCFWAQRRAVFGPSNGFADYNFWGICAAYVCQQFPNSDVTQLVAQLFYIFKHCHFGTSIRLAARKRDLRAASAGPLTGTVNNEALRALRQELKRGNRGMNAMQVGAAQWCDLYKPKFDKEKNCEQAVEAIRISARKVSVASSMRKSEAFDAFMRQNVLNNTGSRF